jgi:hypothetical protein
MGNGIREGDAHRGLEIVLFRSTIEHGLLDLHRYHESISCCRINHHSLATAFTEGLSCRVCAVAEKGHEELVLITLLVKCYSTSEAYGPSAPAMVASTDLIIS